MFTNTVYLQVMKVSFFFLFYFYKQLCAANLHLTNLILNDTLNVFSKYLQHFK